MARDHALLTAGTELLRQCLKFDQPADTLLAHFFKEQRQLGARDRAQLSDMVYAVLRYKLLFQHWAALGSGSLERRLAILGLADTEKASVNDQNLGHSWRRGLAESEQSWLQDCLPLHRSDLPERLRHNLPDWLATQLQDAFKEDFWPLMQSLNQIAPLDLRVNLLHAKRGDIQQELAQSGIQTTLTPYSPWGLRVVGKPTLHKLPALERGAFEVQDEGSQLLALLLGAKRGEMVVDFCAGAGGKTLALGAAMRNTGRLYALDTSAHRLDSLKPRLARSGLSNVHTFALAHEGDERIQRFVGKIDRVLVDAPCSGLGTLRRHPDLKWRQTPQAVAALTATQANILQSAARLLKPGGRLVYATCSLLPQENALQAQHFSQTHPQFRLLHAAESLAKHGVEHAQDLCQTLTCVCCHTGTEPTVFLPPFGKNHESWEPLHNPARKAHRHGCARVPLVFSIGRQVKARCLLKLLVWYLLRLHRHDFVLRVALNLLADFAAAGSAVDVRQSGAGTECSATRPY